MNSLQPLTRKIIYLAAIAALLVPMYWLAKPAVKDMPGRAGDPGGVLAQLREKHQLSQASLGEIDPASETMRLSLLGMQGVAVNILWMESGQYQMKKDWMRLAATLDQIAKIAPNFINAWLFQGQNIAFNCVAEFDDYHEKYRWIIYGIDYLRDGIKYNSREPVLQNRIGYTIEQKIGRSDEKRLMRKLFVADNDFHGNRAPAERDCWLVSREWYREAVDMVDKLGVAIRGLPPVLYRCSPALNLMYYAESLENDGTFGETARRAWKNAEIAWNEYGQCDIPADPRQTIRLGELEACQDRIKKWTAELDALEPGLRDKISSEKREKLTDAQRRALDTPADQRNEHEAAVAADAEAAIRVAHSEVAARIPADKKKQAAELADKLNAEETTAYFIRRDRDIVNYDRWLARARIEQEPEVLEANELVYSGNRALSQAKLTAAREAYDKAWRLWRKVIDRHPDVLEDVQLRGTLSDNIHRYQYLFKQLAEPFPKDFPLKDVLKRIGEEM